MRLLPLLTCLLLALPAAAQPSNVEVLSEMAVGCIPDQITGDGLVLDPPSRPPFLSGALVSALQARDVTVLAPEGAAASNLSMDLSRAAVAYGRAPGGRIARTVSMAMAVRLVVDEVVVVDRLCEPSRSDVISRAAAEQVNEPAYPETRADVPQSLWQRAVQPAVITLATAAGTVLFFSLRSRRADGG
ncbi:MAG: hypothetical protein JJ896_02135 [Rhodothermales bacterium]|nr:hypothetical protein [Rhodothermales bacterium]MBO6778428.1 hypothetical protein [Rhodothermales bacterium]